MKATPKPNSCGKYLVGKRNDKFYKIFLKDVKCIKVRSKKVLPPVPAFDRECSLAKEIDTSDS